MNPNLDTLEISYGGYWTGNYCARWSRDALSGRQRADKPDGELVFNEHIRSSLTFLDEPKARERGGSKVEDVAVTPSSDQGRTGTVSNFISWVSRLVDYVLL
jgi:hypothetical protein